METIQTSKPTVDTKKRPLFELLSSTEPSSLRLKVGFDNDEISRIIRVREEVKEEAFS